MIRLLSMFFALLLGYGAFAQACGLHLQVKNKLRVSYPGALEVGVALVTARQLGVLRRPNGRRLSRNREFLRVIEDLEQLRRRIANDLPASSRGSAANGFSVLLIGSGLWSNLKLTSAGVLARYHVDGPVDGQPVLVTHRHALQTMLSGDLTLRRAYELRLLILSGSHTTIIRRALESAFQGHSRQLDARF